MAILLRDALLCDYDPPAVERADLRIAEGRIVARGARLRREPGDECIDCGGAVVLPGLVNGHTHLYSALAVGMPPPSHAPRNFREILERIWWRLDQALDESSVALSARIGALHALRCGTTTLIDHHASPRCIAGSLDLIELELAQVGLRGVLCYETSDRHGSAGRQAGLEENRRYLARCAARPDGLFAGLAGAHASFTLEDETLDALAELCDEFGVGVHIHVAEDPCDERESLQRHGRALIDRLDRHGLLRPRAVLAHCTHLNARALARVNQTEVTVAHNARSNMNNAVGYAPIASLHCPVMLGTDGIGADMLAEARAAWYLSRHEHAGRTPADMVAMLAAAARRASAALGVTLGRLQAGAAADVVLTDYLPHTPLTAENLAAHLLFGLSSANVRGVLVAGRWRLRDRLVVDRDEAADRAAAREAAAALWSRMASQP